MAETSAPALPAKRRRLPRRRPRIVPLGMDAAQAAAYCGIGRSLFLQMHSSGQLGPMPRSIGSRKVWLRTELKAWMKIGCPSRADWQSKR
jgi:predicted DNA-binding transcriptional regulator AlpA